MEHKESRDPEPLTIGTGAVSAILRDCGIDETRIHSFEAQCAQQFGDSAALRPANLIDSGKFEVKKLPGHHRRLPERATCGDPGHRRKKIFSHPRRRAH